MALTSPGVEVTIIDQSQYLPAPTGTIPLVVIATAQNKANPTGTGVAQGTTAANANKLFQITSQRDLVTIYGNPFFYTTTNGTPIQGYELNEYGLLAAYSVLGATNRAYVLRADIDLASLVGQTGRPAGAATEGQYWLDTTNSQWGIFEWNATTQKFVEKTPIVINDSTLIVGDYPAQSIGAVGDYAVNALPITGVPSNGSPQQYFYKNGDNQWVVVGSEDWLKAWPTVQGTISNPTLTAGTFTIALAGVVTSTATITITSGDLVYDVANAINALGWSYLSAQVVSGKLTIYSSQVTQSSTPLYVTLGSTTPGLLSAMGLSSGSFNQPIATYGTSAQMPLWQTGQSSPRPSGSVWMKVGASGNGLQQVLTKYNSTTGTWAAQTITYASNQLAAITELDPTGGKNIPAGTIIGTYGSAYQQYGTSPVFLYTNVASGPTEIVGTVTNPSIPDGTVYVYVSQPNNSTPNGAYYVTLDNGSNSAEDFVTAWAAAGIPYTTATVSTDGAIVLSHTAGGLISMLDYEVGAGFTGEISGNVLTVTSVSYGLIKTGAITEGLIGSSLSITSQLTGQPGGIGTYQLSGATTLSSTTIYQFPAGYAESYEILSQAGFEPGVNDFAYESTTKPYVFVVQQSLTTGTGSNVWINFLIENGYVSIKSIDNPGSGYAVGEVLTFNGTLFGGSIPNNNVLVEVTNIDGSGGVTGVTFISGVAVNPVFTTVSNWTSLTYTANEGAPVNAPANNTNWFYSVVNQVDVMVNTSTGWKGYNNVEYDSNGFPTPGGSFNTDPNGPLVSATAPTTQSDGSALVYGDLWIDTSDLELYPLVSRWQSVAGEDKWVLIDNTDQVTSTGILFADARWATNGTTNPANDPIPTIKSLLTSNYLDLDAPDNTLYPVGMLLWNTRRSGYNVKQYKVNYFNAVDFPDQVLPTETDAWVSVSGLQSNGAPYMGRKAQRAMVVQALRSAIDTNTDIRDEDNAFNLIATPNYPELQPNMVMLNSDRGETGYILGDTPMGLPDSATAIQAWATNAAGAASTGEDGCVTRNTYLGLFYPSGLATDLSGNQVAVPASHMMLRTFVRNDTVAYPWLAAAGTRRGIIDNATNIGYLNRSTGEFQVIKTRIGIRDVLYTNFINPLVFFTGNGLLNYGNKTSFNSQSALDRTNVARLIAYIRRQLTVAARPFVFEPNDALTRQQIAGVVESLMIDLVAKRGIYDYLVVCDESNNTPARIDRNELWVDVAIEPVKAAEFIYVPVRILNTGELAAL